MWVNMQIISKNRRHSYFFLSGFLGGLLLTVLSVNHAHLMTGALMGAGMLSMSMYRMRAETRLYSLQVFSAFLVFFTSLFMVCLTTHGMPADLVSALLTALSPQVVVMLLNYLDGAKFGEGFGHLSQEFNMKLLLQWFMVIIFLLFSNGLPSLFMVWPRLSFDVLCAPIIAMLIMPEICFQNSRFNDTHTNTLSVIHGSMAMGSIFLMGMNLYTVILAFIAVTGLFWNTRNTVEIKVLAWQSIAAASIFLPATNLVSVVTSCALGMGSAKVADLVVKGRIRQSTKAY